MRPIGTTGKSDVNRIRLLPPKSAGGEAACRLWHEAALQKRRDAAYVA
jgi:hypothetical protein